jgi:hypothetical protein
MNSSTRISPIVAGLRFVINMACLTRSCDRPNIRLSPHPGDPTGKSPGQFVDPSVQPLLKKYSDFPKAQISSIYAPSRSSEGRFAIVTDAEWDAVDARRAEDESAFLADGEVVWS